VGCGVCASVCPRGVLKLEHGPPAERYPGAGAPLAGFVPSMQEVDIYGYEAWHAPEQPE
jgi:ferredoxin